MTEDPVGRKVMLLAVEGLGDDSRPLGRSGNRRIATAWSRPMRAALERIFEGAECVFLRRAPDEPATAARWLKVARQLHRNQRDCFLQAIAGPQSLLFVRPQTPEEHREIPCDWVKTISALRNRAGRTLLVAGDETLARVLLIAGLIDEMHLFINPRAVPKEKSIASHKPTAHRWQLEEATICEGGFVYRKYSVSSTKRTAGTEPAVWEHSHPAR